MKSLVQRYEKLCPKHFNLEKYQDFMTKEEADSVFYVTEALGHYICRVLEGRGSLQWVRDNTVDDVEELIDKYEKLYPTLAKCIKKKRRL